MIFSHNFFPIVLKIFATKFSCRTQVEIQNIPSRNWDNTDITVCLLANKENTARFLAYSILCVCSNTFRIFSEYVNNSPSIRTLFCVPQTTLNSLYFSPCMHEYCSHNLRIRLYCFRIFSIDALYFPRICRIYRENEEYTWNLYRDRMLKKIDWGLYWHWLRKNKEKN